MIRPLLFMLMAVCSITGLAQQSPHGPLKIDCASCHSADSWAMMKGAKFDHKSTGFALVGAHSAVLCKSCHDKLVFGKAKRECSSCHTDVHRSDVGVDCLRCHSTQAWRIPDMIQRHDQTRFPLLGQHAVAQCTACHARNADHQYSGTPIMCVGCHNIDFQTARNPNHITAGFSTECTLCHQLTAASWSGKGFDHQLTSFPLLGAHLAVPCIQCHVNNQFVGIRQNCIDCHRAQFASALSPNHTSGSFSTDCLTCHTMAGWQPAAFNHAATRFPLTGAHVPASCQMCHTNGNYQLVYANCYQCHQANFQGATNPNHVAGGFAQTCDQCHSTTAWSPATFNHATTRFPLTGAHMAVPCATCHVNGNYQIVYANCYQCHQANFQGATNPNHVAGGFAQACDQCHSTTAWSPATFNHATTRFPLTGAHMAVPCATCHVNGNYQLVYTTCSPCHQTDFQGATNPNHVTGGFAQTCDQCHSTTAWSPATFNHASTRFPLTGAHTSLACQTCHTNGNYQLVYTSCNQCHATDFAGAATPVPHTGFSTDCTTCHTTTAWSPSTFTHANVTPRFPNDNRHNGAACAKCHQTPANYTIICCLSSGCHNTCAGGDD